MANKLINLETDLNKIIQSDANLFFKKLYIQKNYSLETNRGLIFNTFPDLKLKLNQAKTELSRKKVIKKFITGFYKLYKTKINYIIKRLTLEVSNNNTAILQLGSIMNFKWSSNFCGYTIIPTILPFSPFENNTIFYSILGNLLEPRSKNNNMTITIMHEVSHFILHDKMNHGAISKKLIKSGLLMYYLQEIVAIVLLNQKSVKNSLKLYRYFGNPDIENLYISYNNKNWKLTSFFIYLYSGEKYNNFDNFIVLCVEILLVLLPILTKKYQL